MSLSDFPSTVFDTLKSRFSNPLLGSALISWPFINYKLMLIIFGGGGYVEKIEFIESKLYFYPHQDIVNLFGIPFLVGLIYWLFYPWADAKIVAYSIRQAAKKAKIILDEERKIPFDNDMQVDYFKKYDDEKETWKRALQEANESSAKKIELGTVTIRETNIRLMNQTRVLFALNCGIGKDEAPLLEFAFSNENPFHPSEGFFRKIKNYVFYDQMRMIARESINIRRYQGSAKRQVTLDWVRRTAPIPEDEETGFFDILRALNILDVEDMRPVSYIAKDDLAIEKIILVFEKIDALQ